MIGLDSTVSGSIEWLVQGNLLHCVASCAAPARECCVSEGGKSKVGFVRSAVTRAERSEGQQSALGVERRAAVEKTISLHEIQSAIVGEIQKPFLSC